MAAPRLAVYVSGHGFGHMTRTSAFLQRLLRVCDCDFQICSAGSPELWPTDVRARVRSWRSAQCDVGVIQADELTVDHAATQNALRSWDEIYPRRLDEEVRELRDGITAVIGDVPALAFDAAAVARIPSFALANFSWDWIYERMGFAKEASSAARAYERAGMLFELTPAAPMSAFKSRRSLGVFGRTAAQERGRARAALRVASQRLVLVAFRSAASYALPPSSSTIRYVTCDGRYPERSDVIENAHGLTFLELLAAADLVVAKAGYGIIADAASSGTPLLYTVRTGFPEDDVLDTWLGSQPWARSVTRRELAAGSWGRAVGEVLGMGRPEPLRSEGIAAALDTVRRALLG